MHIPRTYLATVYFTILHHLTSRDQASQKTAVYESGTGTWGHVWMGTWDSGTRDEGLENIKYGTRGLVGRGRGDVRHSDAEDTGCE